MHMKTKQKTITSTWRTIAFVERESWKHNRFNTGGITDEMAVKTKPPSDVKDPSISFHLVSSHPRISKKIISPKNGQNQAIIEIIAVCRSR